MLTQPSAASVFDACVPTAVAQGLSYLENYQTITLGNPTVLCKPQQQPGH